MKKNKILNYKIFSNYSNYKNIYEDFHFEFNFEMFYKKNIVIHYVSTLFNPKFSRKINFFVRYNI